MRGLAENRLVIFNVKKIHLSNNTRTYYLSLLLAGGVIFAKRRPAVWDHPWVVRQMQ